jgi:hypothetical protein
MGFIILTAWSIGPTLVPPPFLALRVWLVGYPWYQTSSVALECLESEHPSVILNLPCSWWRCWVLSSMKNNWLSATKSISMWGAPIRCSPQLLYQISQRINLGVHLAIIPNLNQYSFFCLTLKSSGQCFFVFDRSPWSARPKFWPSSQMMSNSMLQLKSQSPAPYFPVNHCGNCWNPSYLKSISEGSFPNPKSDCHHCLLFPRSSSFLTL